MHELDNLRLQAFGLIKVLLLLSVCFEGADVAGNIESINIILGTTHGFAGAVMDKGTIPGDSSAMRQSNHHTLVSMVLVSNQKVREDKVPTSGSTRTVFSPNRGINTHI